MAFSAHSTATPAGEPATIHQMQTAWEFARAARNLVACEADDKDAELRDIEDRLEDLMTDAPICSASDAIGKLWLLREGFDAGWSPKAARPILDQLEAFIRSGVVGSIRGSL